MKYIFEIKTDFTVGTKKEWKSLWDKAENANFYNSPMWFEICLKTFNYKKIKIVQCFLNNDLIAMVPLYESKEYGVSVYITPLSNAPILFTKVDKKVIKSMCDYLKNLNNVVIFEMEEKFVHENGLERNSVVSSERPYIKIANIKQELSGKSFKKIRTRLRNIGSGLTYVSKQATIKDIETIKKIEQSSSKVDNGSEIFSLEKINRLYKNFVEVSGQNTFVGFMHHEKKPIVSDFYVIGKNIAHSAHTSFNKEFIKYWPGNLLQFRILEEFVERGDIDEVDLGRGINAFKMKFATGVRKYNTVYFISDPIRLQYLLLISSLSKTAHHIKETNKIAFASALLLKKIAKKLAK